MTIPKIIPVLFVSTGLIGGSAVAQSMDDRSAGEENPNAAIERQIEAETGDGDPAPETVGDVAATGQSDEPVGSGAVVEWVGKPIAAIDGTKVGTISDVMIDGNGVVTEIHARVGGLFGLFTREVAIPAARIILERDGMIIAELSEEDITRAPRVSG